MSRQERGLWGKITGAAKEILRDHTPEDEERVLRIINGQIVPGDRDWFFDRQWQQLTTARPPIDLLATRPQIVLSWELDEAKKELQRLGALPPEELDKKIADTAQEQARTWGLLPPKEPPLTE